MVDRVDRLTERQEKSDITDELVANFKNAVIDLFIIRNIVHLDGAVFKLDKNRLDKTVKVFLLLFDQSYHVGRNRALKYKGTRLTMYQLFHPSMSFQRDGWWYAHDL